MKITKRLLSLLLAIALVSTNVACITPAIAAGGDTPAFEVTSAQGNPGDTGVQININVKNNPGVASVAFLVSYDSTRLALKAVKFNSVDWAGGNTMTSKELTSNPYSLSWINGTGNCTVSDSTFATLTFDILDSAPSGNAEVSITYDPDNVCDVDFNNVTFSVSNGHITVLNAPINSASVTIASPVRGQALPDFVTCGSSTYTGQVVWYEGSAVSGEPVTGNAKSNTVYTAQITLTPGEGQSFADTVAVTVNGDTAGNIAPTSGNLVVSKTFPATADKEVPTCTAPTGLTATYGQTLADIVLINPDGNTEGSWAWKDNTQPVGNVGTNTFKATFVPSDAENYATVDVDVSVTVSAKSVTPSIIVEPAVYDYTGQTIVPTTVIVKDGDTVIATSEYTLAYTNNTDVGTATVTVSDLNGGNYIINQASADFTIRQALGTIEILDPVTITYDGSAVECGEGKDLNFTYTGDGTVVVKWYADNSGVMGGEISAPVDAGNYWLGVSATAGANYAAVDEVAKRFTVSPKPIDGAEVTLGDDPTYDGTEKTMTVTSVTVDGLTATYTVPSGEKGINAGDYTLEIAGNGNFTGTVEKGWKILPAPLNDAIFAAIDDQDFTNQDITPKPAVTLGGKTLTEGIDFIYTYSTNRYVGTATVNVNGKGNYTGAAVTDAAFTIAPVSDPALIVGTATVTRGGNTIDLSRNVTNAVGAVSYTVKSGEGSVNASGVYTSAAESGIATVTVSVSASDLNNDGANEYMAKTADVVVTIMDKTVATLDVLQTGCTFGETLPVPTYTEPAGTIRTTKTYTGTTRSGVAYESTTAPVDAGTYTVKVVCETATQLYEGTSNSFTIAPKSIDGAEIALGDTLIYNTRSQTQSVSAVTLGSVDVLPFCDVTGNTATDAGDYTLTVTAKEASNYTGSVQKMYTVSKKSITPTVEGLTAVDYTGSQLTQSAVVVKDGSNTLVASDYDLVYGENINAGVNAGTLTIKARSGGNYIFQDVTVTFTINKVAYPGATTMTSEAKQGTSRTVDIGSLLAEGYDLGPVSVTADADKILDGVPTIAGTILTFAFADDGPKSEKTATIQIPVTSTTNYMPYDIVVTVTMIGKPTQSDFKFTEATQSAIYGETLTFPAIGAVAGSEVTYTSEDPTVAMVDETGKVTTLKVGTTTITATTSPTEEYTRTIVSYTLQVDKATVTVSAKDRSIYVGDTVPDLTDPKLGTDYIVTGLVGKDILTGTVKIKYQMDGEDVIPDSTKTGSYDIVISGVSEPEGGNYNAIILANGTLTVSTRPYSGEEISSGTTTTTEKHEDGSVTTTVTDRKTGTVTETTKYPDGSETVVITEKDGAKTITVIIPTEAVDEAEENNEAVQVQMPNLSPAENTENATPVLVDLSGKDSAKIKIPVEDVTPGTVVVVVKADGTEEIVKPSVPVEGGIILTVKQGETLKVVDNSKHFADVEENTWYADEVKFVAARELFEGTSATEFSPNIAMSRGMLVTVLHRLENKPQGAHSSFTDVASNQYYADAIGWAAANDIVRGYGNGTFGPDDPITREQLAVLLWRYAGSPQSTGSLDSFVDGNKTATWAVNALRWAVEQGIVIGKGNSILDPQGQATRAEVATMFRRYIQIMMDK